MAKGIDRLIICDPYNMPQRHYRYDSEQETYHLKDERRPSGYQSMDKNGVYGMHRTIDSVNRIRPLVDEWREKEYPGTTKTTKELLNHWKDRDENRFFFCQIEAIETIIYAAEHPKTISRLIKNDSSTFGRYCTKMATGTGKTLVMGMLIAWQALNTGGKYTKNILVVTPNLTVRDRLQVLVPGHRDNIYDEFDLVPRHAKGALGGARVTITNFQQLRPKTAKPNSVAKLGTQSPRSFARTIVGRNVSRLLVINDEGHHAWRPSDYEDAHKKEVENAGMWMSGLDLIHEACTILQCHDFSATPFVPTGKSSSDEKLFNWIISDFSLSDAIESGLVKTPRTPENGDRFYHLYQKDEVREPLNRRGATRLPKLVEDAYCLLGGDWVKTKKEWEHRSTPPVMITVCNTTRHARLVVDQFEKNTLALNEDLTRPESLLHIDSEAVKAIESDESKRELRSKVATVGRAGQPGERVCNIVSVDMLTEGWDARTVTHIMGIRAFQSQLLCEQVVGRGLRRTNYEINDKGLFDAEYVQILGVPFAAILSETKDKPQQPSGRTVTEIYPDKPEHLISWPQVTNIHETITFHAGLDWADITPLDLGKSPAMAVNVGPVVDNWTVADTTMQVTQRRQTAIYGILQDVMSNHWRLNHWSWDEYTPYNENPQQITIEVLNIVKKYVEKYVQTRLDEQGLAALLQKYRDAIARHIFTHIVKRDSDSGFRAVIDGTGSTRIPRKTTTKKIKFKPKKTHLNYMTGDSELERSIGQTLDADRRVLSWAKSDMAGFAVPYTHPDGTGRNYRPDFIAHLETGIQLILEGKGKEDDTDRAKKRGLERWVEAVNLDGEYGMWGSGTIFGGDIRAKLDDIIRLTADRKHAQTCQACGAKSGTLQEGVEVFGLEKTLGILKLRKLCKRCMSSKNCA